MTILSIIGQEYKKARPKVAPRATNKNVFKLGEAIGNRGLIYWGREIQLKNKSRTCMLVCPKCDSLFRGSICLAKNNKLGPCC